VDEPLWSGWQENPLLITAADVIHSVGACPGREKGCSPRVRQPNLDRIEEPGISVEPVAELWGRDSRLHACSGEGQDQEDYDIWFGREEEAAATGNRAAARKMDTRRAE